MCSKPPNFFCFLFLHRVGAMTHESTTCFVCMQSDGAPLKCRCQCNVFAHDACLIRTIKSVPSHALRCPICTAPYRNVSRHVLHRVECDTKLFLSLLMGVCCMGFTFAAFQLCELLWGDHYGSLTVLMIFFLYFEGVLIVVMLMARIDQTSTALSLICLRKVSETTVMIHDAATSTTNARGAALTTPSQ